MKRALISTTLAVLVSGLSLGAVAQGKASARHVHHVSMDESGTPYQADLVPTTMEAQSSSIEIGADHWSARGYDLRTLIAQVFDMDARLVDLPEGVSTEARYDLTVSTPTEVSTETMQRILVSAIEKKFQFKIAPESRTMDVYVLTAPNGPGADLHRHIQSSRARLVGTGAGEEDGGGRITYMGRACSGVTSGGISVEDGTIAEFRQTLEPDLDRVLLDETNLHGSYDFKIGTYANQAQLFQMMQNGLGLVVSPAQRKVTVLAAHPVDSLQAKL